MARKPPGAIRAIRAIGPQRCRPVRQIPGISRRTRSAIHRIKARHLGRGTIAEALYRYERFLHQPGRYLYVPRADCPCCNPTHARDVLADALRKLPPPARAGFRRILTPLDEEFLRRTLPYGQS